MLTDEQKIEAFDRIMAPLKGLEPTDIRKDAFAAEATINIYVVDSLCAMAEYLSEL